MSIDAWTTPHQTMGILGIAAHFIGPNAKFYNIVLGFEELIGQHSGSNMADLVVKVVEDYGVSQSLGYLGIKPD